MGEVLKGAARKFGDEVNTDYIIAAKRKTQTTELDQLVQYIMEDIRPGFFHQMNPGDFIVGGVNFGCGSSRENAPQLLKHAKVSAVIAQSFARIFYRNCVAVGLLPIICDTREINEGDRLEFDPDKGEVMNLTTGKVHKADPLPRIMQTILQEGGVLNYIIKHGRLSLDV